MGLDAPRRPVAGRDRPRRRSARWPASPPAIAILFIVIIALAGLGLVVVNALSESAWGTFTIGATIPLALFMGFYMYRFRTGQIAEATVIGVIGLLLAVAFGKPLAGSAIGWVFTLTPASSWSSRWAAYGFVASVLPVWLLLARATTSARS